MIDDSNAVNETSFRSVVLRAVRNQASDDERAMLTHDSVRGRYRAELLDMKREVEAQLVKRKADLASFQTQCFKDGTKAEWFEAENAYNQWRAGLSGYSNAIEKKLAELNATYGKSAGSGQGVIDAKLDRVIALLSRIADALDGQALEAFEVNND